MVAFQNFKRVVCEQSSTRSNEKNAENPGSSNQKLARERAAAGTQENISSAQKNLAKNAFEHEEVGNNNKDHNLLNNKKISGVRS